MAGSTNPELARLLANLNAYSSGSGQSSTFNYGDGSSGREDPSRSANYTNHSITAQSGIPGLGFLPEPTPRKQNLASSIDAQRAPSTSPSMPDATKHAVLQLPQPSAIADPRSNLETSRPTTPSIPISDASTITTWPAALKHVTKHLVPNAVVATRIKHLIESQHAHERQWHAGREAILARQNGREGTAAQVSALLKSLGGKDVRENVGGAGESLGDQAKKREQDERELSIYDVKVYKGLLEMAGDFDRQLRKLGVPFFAIKWELVIMEGHQAEGKARVDKGELRELQARMVQLLEDLFAE